MTSPHATTSTTLKELLQERHLQTHSAFCREYRSAAVRIGERPEDIPSKAQFYRWLSGQVLSLPYPSHCRVLEEIFPGRKVKDLLSPPKGKSDFNSTMDIKKGVADIYDHDVSDIFASRTDFLQAYPPVQLMSDASRIRMVGISLNVLCQQIPDSFIRAIVTTGTSIELVFLSPNGQWTRERDREEGHDPGTLSALTALNIGAMLRLRDSIPSDAKGSLQIRVYDEPPRYNIILIGEGACAMQPYLPFSRGLECPTFYIEDREACRSRLYTIMDTLFGQIWERSIDYS